MQLFTSGNAKAMRYNKFEDLINVSQKSITKKMFKVSVCDYETGKSGNYTIEHSRHSRLRSQQRGIENDAICIALEYGKVFLKQGLQFYVLGKKYLPPNLPPGLSEKFQNTVVVLSQQGTIITCYKNCNAMRNIHKKPANLIK